MLAFFVGFFIMLNTLVFLWWTLGTSKLRELDRNGEDEEDGDIPTVYVFCDYNPDEVKMFYEIPDALAELIQPADSSWTFTECLALLVDLDRRDDK